MSTGDASSIPLGKLTIDVSELQARMNQAASMFNTLAQNINRAFTGTSWDRFKNAGTEAFRAVGGAAKAFQPQIDALKTSVAGATAALAGLTAAGLRVGMSYEQSMARVKSITQATADEMAMLSKEAQRLGVKTVHSAKDAADGFAILAQGGYKVQQIMKMMPSIFNLVDIAQTNTAAASQVVVNVMESMQIKAEDLPKTMDKLARAMTMGGNDMMEFADAFKYVAPLAKSAGYSLEEVAATLQILGKNGLHASMAGTSLRGMLQALTEAPPKLKKDFKELGINVFDATGKLQSLPKVLDELQRGFDKSQKQGGSMGNIMQDFGARAGVGVTTLLNVVKAHRTQISDAVGDIQKAAQEGYAEKAAEGMRKTVQSRLTMVMGTLSGFGVTLIEHMGKQTEKRLNALNEWISVNKKTIDKFITTGWDAGEAALRGFIDATKHLWEATDGLRNSLSAAGEKVSTFVSRGRELWDKMPSWAKDIIKVSAGFMLMSKALNMGGLAGRIPIIGELVAKLSLLVNPLGWVRSMFTALRALLPAVIALFGALASPVGIVVGVVAALGFGLKTLYDRSEAFRTAIDKGWTAIKQTVIAFVDAGKAKFAEFVTTHQQQFDRIADKSSEIFGKVKKLVSETADWLIQKFGDAMSSLTGGQIKDFEGAWNAVADVADVVLDAFERLLDWFNGDGKGLQSIGISIAMAWNSAMASMMDSLADFLEQLQATLNDPKISALLAAAGIGVGAQIGVRVSVAALRSGATGLRTKNADLAQQQQEIEQQRQIEKDVRDKRIRRDKTNAKRRASRDAAGAANEGALGGFDVNAEIDRQAEGAAAGAAHQTAAAEAQQRKREAAAQQRQANIALRKTASTDEVASAIYSRLEASNATAAQRRIIRQHANRYITTLRRADRLKGSQHDAARAKLYADADAAMAKIEDLLGVTGKEKQKEFTATAKGADAEKQKGAALEAGRVDFAQQNAGQEALVNQQVAAAGQGQGAADQGAASVATTAITGTGRAAVNQFRQQAFKGKQAIQQARAGGATKQQGDQLAAQFQQYLAMLMHAQTLSGEQQAQAQEQANKMLAGFNEMAGAAGKGKDAMKAFNAAALKAAKGADDLADAEDKAAHGHKGGKGAGGAEGLANAFEAFGQRMQGAFNAIMAPFNAFGQFMQQLMAPWQQAQQAAQQMQQFQQEAAQNPILNPIGFALQGGEDLQSNLADAIKSGDPKQIRAAIQALRDYANAQIQMTLQNIGNVPSSPNEASFGAIGGQGAGVPINWQQKLTENPQAAGTIKLMQDQIANLDKMLAKLPKMADGGIVSSPTYAMIGERGPEAVIPLNRLAQLFGNPANIFPGSGLPGAGGFGFRINPGGGALNPLALTGGGLANFDALFNRASGVLNQQLDLGNLGAGGLLSNWGSVTQAAENALTYARGRRTINLGGNSRFLSGMAPNTTAHFSFGNIHVANATDQEIGSLFDRIEAEANRRGYSVTNTRRNSLGSYQPNGRSSPLAPSGSPR